MSAVSIDGRKLAKEIRKEIRIKVKKMIKSGERPPKLAVIMVGNNPASAAYVRNKLRSCEKTYIEKEMIHLEDSVSENELLSIVQRINEQDDIDGIIVQLPLPSHIDENKVTLSIEPAKDVDGFHPQNIGRMALGFPAYIPATPKGILEMIKRYDIETEGKHCVVVGRSAIVGTPMSILMSRKAYPGNATVTLTHSRTRNLEDLARSADILIAAIGRANFITSDMVKSGAVVIDVGINRVDIPNSEKGYKLVGDVDYDQVVKKAGFITPVPGGVGQLTVTSLLENTLLSRQKSIYR
jgi:methylenetetrahydrofolate dehydrogenase (NADP+)/methenyltetrahydrofolate cyclohydrolase